MQMNPMVYSQADQNSVQQMNNSPFSRKDYDINPIYGEYRNSGLNWGSNNSIINRKRYRDAQEYFADRNDIEGLKNWVRENARGINVKKANFERARIKALGSRLGKEAEDFEQNVDNYTNDQYGLLEKDVQRNLNKGLEQTRKNYSSRGLLYSGLRQGAEAQQRGQAASYLAESRSGIKSELMDMAAEKRKVAAAVGLAGFQQAQDSARELSNLQMQNAIARRRNAAALGQGIGYAVGAFYNPQTSSAPSSNLGSYDASTYYDGLIA